MWSVANDDSGGPGQFVANYIGTDTHIFCRVIECKRNILKCSGIDSYPDEYPSINSYETHSGKEFAPKFRRVIE